VSTKDGHRFGDPRKRVQVIPVVPIPDRDGWATLAIAACRPVDMTTLPDLGIPVPAPCVDDTIQACKACGADCWVSPRKLALASAGRAVVLCFGCAIASVGPDPEVVDLHPDRVEHPRLP
jgi:hypothetical protein